MFAKLAMEPKPAYGLVVGRRQSYHLPFGMQTDETWRGEGSGTDEWWEEVDVLADMVVKAKMRMCIDRQL